jgi:hypothetical protein
MCPRPWETARMTPTIPLATATTPTGVLLLLNMLFFLLVRVRGLDPLGPHMAVPVATRGRSSSNRSSRSSRASEEPPPRP